MSLQTPGREFNIVGNRFTNRQILTLVVLERTGGALSLAAVVLVFVFYVKFPRLRTVPNTFIMFASVANAGASVASLIAYDGVKEGKTSPLCQAQGFMFEMFMQSDPWWSLAMAINVVRIFMAKTPQQNKLIRPWLLCLICYGGPGLIALLCLLLSPRGPGSIYGDAGIWCWISNDWNPLRIYSYYLIIWFCILFSLVIYLCIGVYVFRARNRLHAFPCSSPRSPKHATTPSPRTPRRRNFFRGSSIYRKDAIKASKFPLVVTEVSIIRDLTPDTSPTGPTDHPEAPMPTHTIERSRAFEQAPTLDICCTGTRTIVSAPNIAPPANISAFELASIPLRAPRRCAKAVMRRFSVADPVKSAYLRTSLLFALSVLVTWIPSSLNRMRGLVFNDSPYGYAVATAAVLPLQGVWNGLIFFMTSWKMVRECLAPPVPSRPPVPEAHSVKKRPLEEIDDDADLWTDFSSDDVSSQRGFEGRFVGGPV